MKSLRPLLQRVLVGAWRSPAARVFFAVWLVILLIEPLRHIASTVQQDDNVYSNGFANNKFNVYVDYDEYDNYNNPDYDNRRKKALTRIVALPKERAGTYRKRSRSSGRKCFVRQTDH